MPPKLSVSVGDRFGKVVVLEILDVVNRNRQLRVRCDCGNEKVMLAGPLQGGRCVSCGCVRQANLDAIGDRSVKHGMTGTSTYRTWSHMKRRCLNPSNRDYPEYGGRGITVCQRWLESFKNFLSDMGEKPPGHSIDRIDSNGNYEPSNCRWATDVEQARNTRGNKLRPHLAFIREAVAAGRTYSSIARELKVSRRAVESVAKGRTWGGVQ